MLLRPLHFYSMFFYNRQVWVRRVSISSGTDSVSVLPAGGIVPLTPTATALWQTQLCYASCYEQLLRTVARMNSVVSMNIIQAEITGNSVAILYELLRPDCGQCSLLSGMSQPSGGLAKTERKTLRFRERFRIPRPISLRSDEDCGLRSVNVRSHLARHSGGDAQDAFRLLSHF